MSCAALVPADDPFITLMFFKSFDTVWQDEVEKLYICYNSDVDEKVANYVRDRFLGNPKVTWLYMNRSAGAAEPLVKCLEVCGDDYIVFMENDSYVYQKGVIRKCFNLIKGGQFDAVGSPRGSCSQGLYKILLQRFGCPATPSGDAGPNFEPCFFFAKRKDILKTDLNFGSKTFPKEVYIKELDWTPTQNEDADTFGWMSIQLRAMHLNFGYVPQCRVYPGHNSVEDIYPFGWLHFSSGSAAWTGRWLRGTPPDKITNRGELLEFEKRAALWKMAATIEPYEGIADFKKTYLQGIENLINHYKLNRERIDRRVMRFAITLIQRSM